MFVRGAPPGQFTSGTYIWISDTLLRDHFNHFFAIRPCRCIRYASNVPGPLEARRRLSKRRLNHIAVSSAGKLPLSPPLFNFEWLGAFAKPPTEPKWNWEPPWLQKQLGDKTMILARDAWLRGAPRDIISETYPRLPTWLDVKHPLIPPPSPRNWSLADSEIYSNTNSDTDEVITTPTYTNTNYQERLEQVNNLSDLRLLHAMSHIPHLRTEARSILDFDRLLELYNGKKEPNLHHSLMTSLFEFLEDAELEHSNGRNLARWTTMLNELTNNNDDLSERHINTLVTLARQQLQVSSSLELHHVSIVCDTMSLIGHDSGNITADKRLELSNTLWDALTVNNSKFSMVNYTNVCRAFLRHVLNFSSQSITANLVKDVLRVNPWIFATGRDMDLNSVNGIPDVHEVSEDECNILQKSALFLLMHCTTKPGIATHVSVGGFLSELNDSKFVSVWAIDTAKDFITLIERNQESESGLALLNEWLLSISQSGYTWSNDLRSRTWTTIFQTISSFVRPADIAPLLSRMPRYEVPMVVIRHWLTPKAAKKPLSEINSQSASLVEQHKPRAVIIAGSSLQASIPQVQEYEPNSFFVDLEADWCVHANHPVDTGTEQPKLCMLYSRLLRALVASREYSWEESLEHLLELTLALDQIKIFDHIVRFAKRFTGRSITIKHRSLLESYINRHSARKPEYALRIFNLDRRLLLSRCPQLPLSLINSSRSRIHPERILALLPRRDFDAFVHPPNRQYHPNCALAPQRIVLAHEIALAFANATRFRDRAAFHCVQRCYNWLRGHHAPIGPMISQALVIAGMVRPMRAGQDVAKDKLRFILMVVRSVDGEEAADELDRAFWVYRKRLFEGRHQHRGEDRARNVVRYHDSKSVLEET